MKKMPTLGFFKDIQKKITNNSGSGKILIDLAKFIKYIREAPA